MAVVSESQLGSINQSVPQLVIVEIQPNPSIRAARTNVVGVVGQFPLANRNEIYEVGSLADIERKLGGYNSSMDGYYWCKNFFDAGGSILHIAPAMSSGATAATATLYEDNVEQTGAVMSFVMDNLGVKGNDATVKVAQSLVTGYVDITVKLDNQNQSFYPKTTTNSSDDRYIGKLVNKDANKFFRVVVDQTDGTLPELTGSVSFTGGSNDVVGDSLDDANYVGLDGGAGARTGIQLFLEDDEITQIASTRDSDTINTALISHVTNINVVGVKAKVAKPEGTSVSVAANSTATFNYDKVQVHYPYQKVRNVFNGVTGNYSPTAFAAALDSQLNYHLSKTNRQMPAIVIGQEVKLTATDVATLTQNRVNPITYKKAMSSYVHRSDYTTSVNPEISQNFVRKAKDFFILSQETAFALYLGRPIDPELWRGMSSTATRFFQTQASQGFIGKSDGSLPYYIKIDAENNPPSVVQQNNVILWESISLKGVADRIFLYLDVAIENDNV